MHALKLSCRLSWLALICCLCLPVLHGQVAKPSASGNPPGRRLALVVGNSAYAVPRQLS